METQKMEQSMPAPAEGEQSVHHEPSNYQLKRILFYSKGRIDRFSFWIAQVIFGVVCLIVYGVLILAGLADDSILTIIAAIIAVIFLIPIIYASILVHIKRWHDLDISGWIVLLAFVPFINFVYTLATVIFLGFFRGTIGENKYGIDPDPTILCPKCDRRNPINTWHCDCGHSFWARTPDGRQSAV